jgi:hypothetical protein
MMISRLWHKLGFRGGVLACFATFDIVWGWSLIDPDASKALYNAPAYSVMAYVMPFWGWGILMMITGIIIGVNAWLENDSIGYIAAWAIKLIWILFILAAFPRAGIQVIRLALIFMTLAALLLIESRRPELPEVGD